MSYIVDVYRKVGDSNSHIGRLNFEVAPRAGERIALPGGNKLIVTEASHVVVGGPPGGPANAEFAILCE